MASYTRTIDDGTYTVGECEDKVVLAVANRNGGVITAFTISEAKIFIKEIQRKIKELEVANEYNSKI